MTKRFTVEKFTELEYGIKQDGETLIGLSLDDITAKYIVEKWNKLADENEQLRKDVARYRGNFREMEDVKCELAEENEQLKQSYKEFEDECQSTFNAMSRKQNDLYRKNFKLKEENEQLKEELADANELNKIYVDFLVDKGFELSDVVEWSKKEFEE